MIETPVEIYGDIFVKRDDLYRAPNSNAPGGKSRTCYFLAKEFQNNGVKGLVTAGSRSSPQVNIVAQIGKSLGMQVRVHTPDGEPGPEVASAVAAGAIRIAHRAGYNSVIVKRAEDDAKETRFGLIPFGMECQEAVYQTSTSFSNVTRLIRSRRVKRIVVPVGSGVSLCGILQALDYENMLHVKVLGVVVGSNPEKRLDRFVPLWRLKYNLDLIPSGVNYHTEVKEVLGRRTLLDPIYEAKCKRFLEPGDLFWIVGIRQTFLEKNFTKVNY